MGSVAVTDLLHELRREAEASKHYYPLVTPTGNSPALADHGQCLPGLSQYFSSLSGIDVHSVATRIFEKDPIPSLVYPFRTISHEGNFMIPFKLSTSQRHSLSATYSIYPSFLKGRRTSHLAQQPLFSLHNGSMI